MPSRPSDPALIWHLFFVFLMFFVMPMISEADSGPWKIVYDLGFKSHDIAASHNPGTTSTASADGLRIADFTSSSSMVFFTVPWDAASATHTAEAPLEVEVELKSLSCTANYGVSVLLADGWHEEFVTFFPDRIVVSPSSGDVAVPFNFNGQFHRFQITVAGGQMRVFADGNTTACVSCPFTDAAVNGRNFLYWGSLASAAISESVWRSVKFRGAAYTPQEFAVPAWPSYPGFAVQEISRWKIRPEITFPGFFYFSDGSWVVNSCRTYDNGQTFSPAYGFNTTAAYLDPSANTPTTIVNCGFMSTTTTAAGFYALPRVVTQNNGLTNVTSTASLYVPRAVGGPDDGGTYKGGFAFDHCILPLPDGRLLATAYGRFEDDTFPSVGYDHIPGFYKLRTFLLLSEDQGATWSYFSTVARISSLGEIPHEGYNEPDLLRLPSGELLCVMRTGGACWNKSLAWTKGFSPLYLARSSDNGFTWSAPVPIADRGVFPNITRMSNGVIVITTGRPGNWILFSLDNGQTWTAPHCYSPFATSAYTSAAEMIPNPGQGIEPGTLLVVYNETHLTTDGYTENALYAMRIKITLDPPPATPTPTWDATLETTATPTVTASRNVFPAQIRLYPQPARDWLYLSLGDSQPEWLHAEFYTVNGEKALGMTMDHPGNRPGLSLAKLAPGIYLLRVRMRSAEGEKNYPVQKVAIVR